MKSSVNLFNYGDSTSTLNADILYNESRALKREIFDYKFMEVGMAYRHQGDFIGLMVAMGIPANKHMHVMNMNGILNPYEFDGVPFDLKVPKDMDTPF